MALFREGERMELDEGLSEEEYADPPAMADSISTWSSALHDSVFNPAAHSWIIVPAEEPGAVPEHGQLPDASQQRYHLENRVLAELEALSLPVAVIAALPSPAASVVSNLPEGSLAAPEAAPAEQQLPDGVPAWTQAQMGGAHGGACHEEPVRGKADTGAHAQAEREDAAAAPEGDRWERSTPAEARRRGLRLRKLQPAQLCPNWNDPGWQQWKWLLVTNAATLLLGVYLGSACAGPGGYAASSGGGTSPAVSPREACAPAAYRVS